MDLREAVEVASEMLAAIDKSYHGTYYIGGRQTEALRTLIEAVEHERPATLQFLRFVAKETLLYAAVASEVLKSVANQIERGRHLKRYIPDQRKETGDGHA